MAEPDDKGTPPVNTGWDVTKMDAETQGYLQNRGWHDKPVHEVAIGAIQAHREAAKLIGVPQNELLRLPKDAKDEAGWNAVHERLGRPKEAKAYDFTTVKTADGKDVTPALADAVRATAFARGLSQDAAVEVLKTVVKTQDDAAKETAAVRQGDIVKSKEALKQNWGKNFEANMVMAKNAAEAFKLGPEIVDELEKAAGYDKVMDFLRQVGAKMGSADFLKDPNTPGGEKVMTKEQAIARKAELQGDPQWRDRYMAGGVAEKREMAGLVAVIAG